jgi:hypothetical protein
VLVDDKKSAQMMLYELQAVERMQESLYRQHYKTSIRQLKKSE